MLSVHSAETKAKDLLDFSLDIFHLHFASQNNEWAEAEATEVVPDNLCWCMVKA